MTAPILTNPPPMAGDFNSDLPVKRVMNALGSWKNKGDFVFLLIGLNPLKRDVRGPFPAEDTGRVYPWVLKTLTCVATARQYT